jgi:cell division septation protein DedD
MKLQLAALLLPAALLAAACDENAPPNRDSRTTSVGQKLSSPVAGGAVDAPIDIPQGAAWTIVCDSITTPDHVQRAAELKAQLIHLTGRKDFYVIHKDSASVIYYGFYKEIRADVNPAEHQRSQADLQWVRTLTDSQTGQPVFRMPTIMPIDGPDPDAPPQWNLANAPADAFWSLQIAAFKDIPDRKQAAVEAVREARKMGIPAYYYHGDTISSVCVGLWPVTAVKNQAEDSRYGDSGHTEDPNESLMVFGNSAAPPGVSNETIAPNGEKAKVMGIKLEILDQTLKDMIRKYPKEVVNDEEHYKQLPNGERFYDQSFLVQVPHDGQSGAPRAPADSGAPDNLPLAPDSSATPDPTQGALRSLGDK